ncbi:hypothetical protein [Magnetospirillum sp. UT-4]|uniref:hypothetical protein n=1 Tax=Magnetospirillum sp. UT-4 TaxID=2681467 RepID=UPI001385863C|nr:hypothetical protein [Magnetospirillum sp. UT-4]CAA7625223.1 conserved hypothetical protein [Magnetospirillum sp. UT-4]
MGKTDGDVLVDLLARWQAFSELQQRAFQFLAAEAVATGQQFENSTDGATAVLTSMGGGDGGSDLQAMTFEVVQKLQAADRSRQGLEQVASVLTTLRRLHAELLAATVAATPLPAAEPVVEAWIAALADTVCLADWRRRLIDALHGRESAPAGVAAQDEDDVLF